MQNIHNVTPNIGTHLVHIRGQFTSRKKVWLLNTVYSSRIKDFIHKLFSLIPYCPLNTKAHFFVLHCKTIHPRYEI